MTDDPGFQKETDRAPATVRKRSDSGFSWGLALFLVAAVAFVVFVVQNTTDVPVQLFGADYTGSTSDSVGDHRAHRSHR